ncbi:hypothetical protein LJC07_02180 [Christensenellaceae bacterium OttesenSCG-928-L17]|nr:hypothetical protein [Christensenellaceae bacterium OttesenSCG-928-L17]
MFKKQMKDKSALEKLLAIRMKEEMSRLDGIPGVSLNEFGAFILLALL